jgi:hypothetical protein
VYSQRAVDLGLRASEQSLGFEPLYHSIAACDSAASYFNDKLSRYQEDHGADPDSLDDLKLGEEDERWMANERALCQVDYLYFATRYGRILSDQEMIHYSPNKGQLIANDLRGKLQDLGWAIILLFLKARQVGITTDSQMVVGHRTFFYPNVVAITGSSDKERSSEMVEKYHAMYDLLPFWLRPRRTANRQGTRTVFGDLNSRLIIQHGAQKFDIGRGNTPNIVHLSELASYLNAEDNIDAGLMPAIHEGPDILVIGESTGEGPFGWLYNTWTQCKINYWKRNGRARWCPMFLPWFVREDYYPTATWLKRNPVPIDWRPQGVTVMHAERARKYILGHDLLRRYYPENWTMPRHQMWFWECTRAEYQAKKTLSKFLHEFAADDMESFMASGESVFDVDCIASYNTHCQEPKAVYEFRAAPNIIPPRLQVNEHDRDTSKPIIEVAHYQLVPVVWNGFQSSSWDGKLLIFEEPDPNAKYAFGVDTADGVGLDRTVVEGMRIGDLERNDAQVCEYASQYINALDLAPILHAIALYYQQNRSTQPKIAIETGLNGELTQLCIRIFGWSNLHLWERYDRKKIDPSKATRIGFVTNRWSRPMLLDMMIKALRDGELDINSPEFVREMQALHRDEDIQMARAESGENDDRFMALGIAYLSTYIMNMKAGKRLSALRQKHRGQDAPSLYDPESTIVATLEDHPLAQMYAAPPKQQNQFRELMESRFALHPGSYSGTPEL